MKYLKHPDINFLSTWIQSVYAGESLRTGKTIPETGCSYGQPRQTLDGDWAIEIVPYAEVYAAVEPYSAYVVEDPAFPMPVDPEVLPK